MRLHANAALALSAAASDGALGGRGAVVDRGGRGRVQHQSEDVLEVGGPLPGGSEAGLLDRSSAPARVANRTASGAVETIAALRRLRFTGPEIAELLDMPLSTNSGMLTRIGMGKLGRLGLEPAERYERARPGELIHIDVKKLGRIERRRRQADPGGHSHYTGSFTDAAGRVRRRRRLGLRTHRDRRRHSPGLRRSPPRREGQHRGRVPAPRLAFYAATASPSSAS